MPRNITVTFADGTRHVYQNAPDDITPDQVSARASRDFGKPVKALDGGRAAQPQAKPTSFLQGVAEGVLKPWNNAARAVEAGVDKIGLGDIVRSASRALGMAPDVASAERAQQQAAARSPYRGSGVGKFVGNVIGTLPAAALPGGALIQGAVGGALLTDARDPRGVLQDAALGAATGKIGEKVVKGVAGAISPKVAPAVRRLQERGIPLTPGQIVGAKGGFVGRTVKATEDKLTSVPGVGDAIVSARQRGMQAFNRAALNEPLSSIGVTMPKSVPAGHEGVAYVERSLGKAYQDLLPKIGGVRADSQFTQELADIAGKADTMLPERSAQFGRIMMADVRRFVRPDGTIDGAGLKAIETRLGARIRNYSGSADPDARELAMALRDAQSAIRGMVARHNPEMAGRLAKINEGWAKLTRVQRAAANASEGVFTPGQLRTATRVADTSARKGASARGDALMQRFAQDAQSVLPSSIPDSGTAGRGMMGLALGGVGGVPAMVASGGGAIPYTQTGGKAVEWLLTGRQGPAAQMISKSFGSLVPVATPGAVAAANQ